MAENLLDVKELQINFYVKEGISKIINGLDLSFTEGSFLGLVGESGSGKSVFANSLLGYVKTPGKIEGGSIKYKGTDILSISEDTLISDYRGKEIGLIASNARAHLNPLLTVGKQLSNVYSVHTKASKKESKERAIEILNMVKINDPVRRYNAYPHELSGGMAQRIMIAMTLINTPNLIIADDCTNGLDVTVAAQVMDLFLDIIDKNNATSIMITHDLGIVAQCCTDIAIMYAGQIVEKAPVSTFFTSFAHPYSEVIFNSLPQNASNAIKKSNDRIDSFHLPKGCLFYNRCNYCTEECLAERPAMLKISDNHYAKCIHPLCGGKK